MSSSTVYQQVYQMLDQHLDEKVDRDTRERITLLVLGIINSESASPAKIAKALKELELTNATQESIERRIRRIENDPEVSATLCFHKFARERLLFGYPKRLLLILDPTTQYDRVVKLTAAIWYRGRALPLVWMIWPANQPIEGDRFWERVKALLDAVEKLLPASISVLWVADRAFGSPAFIDLVTAKGWDYIVRVVKTTRCKTITGLCRQVSSLLSKPGDRAKMSGFVFKKQGWRSASVVAIWGKTYEVALYLVSSLSPRWNLIAIYRRRYPIETLFRDYKSCGWHWEQGQVRDLEHMERLLVAMALATWITVYAGTQVADEYLSKPSTGKRRTVPWEGKRSLFRLGLQLLNQMVAGHCHVILQWQFSYWDAPNWQKHIYFHHSRAFVLGPGNKEPIFRWN